MSRVEDFAQQERRLGLTADERELYRDLRSAKFTVAESLAEIDRRRIKRGHATEAVRQMLSNSVSALAKGQS